MKKKIMLISVLMMYITFALAAPIVFAEDPAEDSSEEEQSTSLFKSEICFDVSTDLKTPIEPGQTKEIEVKVKYKFDIGPLAKWFFFKRRIGRLIMFGPSYFLRFRGMPQTTVNLTIAGSPDWCTAKLDKETLSFEFNKKILDNTIEEQTVKLTLTMGEDAAALATADIKINADSSRTWGRILGKPILTIPGVTNTTSISVQAAYKSNITVNLEKSELTIPPLQNNTISINVTNNGNGKSVVTVNATAPETWNITLDQEEIALEVGETKQVILTYIPPKDFADQPVDIKFTPKSADADYQGTVVTSSIKFHNDGSLKEEGQIDSSIILLIAIPLVVVIAIIIIVLLLRRKKQ